MANRNTPQHYEKVNDTYEPVKVIQAWDLNFCLGNVLKYIARCDSKGAPIEDLKKALDYLEIEINERENE